MKESTKWIGVLLICTLFFSLLGVVARYFDAHNFEWFQQVYIRIALASMLMCAIFWKHISFSKYLHLDTKEKVLLVSRGILSYVWVWLFTYWLLHTTLLNASAIGLFPFTSLFAVIIIGEKLWFKKAVWLGISLFGVYLVWWHYWDFSIWEWETYALIWEALFWLAHILRKFHSNTLSNREIAFGMLTIWSVALFFTSLMVWEWLPNLESLLELQLFVLFFITALFNIFVVIFLNYWFSKLSWIVADRVLTIEIIFTFIFWYMFYSEFPNRVEFLWMLIILWSMLWLQKIEYSEKKNGNSC